MKDVAIMQGDTNCTVEGSKHEAMNCPRCGSEFACKPGSITQCHCFEVKLTPEQQEWIAERWQGCLCGSCLRELSEGNGGF